MLHRKFEGLSQREFERRVIFYLCCCGAGIVVVPATLFLLGFFSPWLLLAVYALAYPVAYFMALHYLAEVKIKPSDYGLVLVEATFIVLLSYKFYAYFENPLADPLIQTKISYSSMMAVFYFIVRILMRLQIAEKESEVEERAQTLTLKKETLSALAPLLDTLHAVYGKYDTTPHLLPASWYEPRKRYIEYMANFLYTNHEKNEKSYLREDLRVEPNAHPLTKLRRLSFPLNQLKKDGGFFDRKHPLTFVERAIDNPKDAVFQKLIPPDVELIPYLKEERWRPALEAEGVHLARLVEQEIVHKGRTIIGTPIDHPQYINPLPIFYGDERFQHTYVIGKTGSGKSTLLRNLITQDIHQGHGLIVLSPENGLFQDLLAYIPEPRKNDLIYFDPTDTQPPVIGFNPLALEKGEDLEAKVGETMTIFKRALGDLGVTMEPLIRNAVYALLQCPNSTITDIHRLIDPQDPSLRRTIANTAAVDELTRKFWIDYDRSTYYQKSFMPVVNRLSIFFRPPLSTILSTPALSFKEEMNKASRIIFLNLSRLRDLQHESTGQLIIAQIQQALLSRNEIPEKHHIPYYLYISSDRTAKPPRPKSCKISPLLTPMLLPPRTTSVYTSPFPKTR
jgi:energy-coupling factor transporter ATP-binding protein EcfA2